MAASIYLRRVQKVGYSTLAVSLPRRWAAKVGLDKGSRIVMMELPDGALLLAPEQHERQASERLKAVLELPEGVEVEVGREVIALYEAGYDTIELAAPREVLDAVRKLIWKRLIGLEVTAESEHSLTLEVVLDHSSLTFDTILGRMSGLVERSLGDLRAYVHKLDPKPLANVVERDDELDKFYFLLVRQASICFRKPELFRRLGLSDSLEILPLLYYGKTLERMGDTLTQLAMYLLESSRPLDAPIVETMERAFSLAAGAFRSDDAALARELALLYSNFFKGRRAASILGDVPLSLAGNFLGLCLDVLDSRVELEAVRRSLRGLRAAAGE